MLRIFRADLHVHTCLSPCGDISMSPRKIARRALEQNIDIIAVNDHNSAENAQAAILAAEGSSLTVLPGMEVCTREEIHVVALFENLQSALELQQIVYNCLYGENDAETFGLQVVANEEDEVVRFNGKLLIGAADLSVDTVVETIHRLGGIAIASHIDRPSYSIIGQLGFIPDNIKFDALEISTAMTIEDARTRYPEYSGTVFVQNSDAHTLDDIGKATIRFMMEKPSFDEIKKAIRKLEGRTVL
jgi:predicted metal-dependent phosphoesterase TrpH